MTPREATLFIVALLAAACATNQEDVCENVGDCAHGGSTDYIQGCKDEAKLLDKEARDNGCAAPFDDYYACANSNFDCRGATPVFPGCDGKRAALDACLARVEAQTACAALAAKRGACSTDDAGVVACTAARDCEARCFLDNVSDVCSPRVDELSTFSSCADRCPP